MLTSQMTTFSFTIIVDGMDVEDLSVMESFGELEYSAMPICSGGQQYVAYEIEGDLNSQNTVVTSVISDLRGRSITPVRIDLDLVNISEIAARTNLNRETVRAWTTGKHRSDFPLCFTTISNSDVWDWGTVYTWLSKQNIEIDVLYQVTPLSVETIVIQNGKLAASNSKLRAAKMTCELVRSEFVTTRRIDWWIPGIHVVSGSENQYA